MQNTWQQSQEFVAVYTFSSISEMSAPYFRCLLGAAGTIFFVIRRYGGTQKSRRK